MLIDHQTRIKIAEWAYSLAQQSSLGLPPNPRALALRSVKAACESFAATGHLGDKIDRLPAFTCSDVTEQGSV